MKIRAAQRVKIADMNRHGLESAKFAALAFVIFAVIFIVLAVVEEHPTGRIAYVTAAGMFLIIPFAVMTTLIVVSPLNKTRVFHGLHLSGKSYAYISDVLHDRGIKSVSSYIESHPAHLDEYLSFIDRLRDYRWELKMEEVEALIFSTDADPSETRRLINVLVAERGLRDTASIREALNVFEDVATPLANGAL